LTKTQPPARRLHAKIKRNRLIQSWPVAHRPLPVVIVGAGGIVNDAHLPAYRKYGIPVAGIHDIDTTRARALAKKYRVPVVYESLSQATSNDDVIYDVAVPPSALREILPSLPRNSAVLIQKPLGRDYVEAERIWELCNQRRLVAAVNFQLRFAPFVWAARDLIFRQNLIGDLLGIEVRTLTRNPWHKWPFLETVPRVEILYGSIHYIDMTRWFLGEPTGVYCKTLPHPNLPRIASSRTRVILDYGDSRMANLCIDLNHEYGRKYHESYIQWEGTRGAIRARMGLMLNYPHGMPDRFEICLLRNKRAHWRTMPLKGSWFPDAFGGVMSNVQRYVAGEDDVLITRVDDALRTMAVVEACYQSSERGATAIANNTIGGGGRSEDI
jgi:predicted dehydrogenase